MKVLFPFLFLAMAASPAANRVLLRDIDGKILGNLLDSENRASVLFFVTNDCPISNQFAPEIQRICGAYSEGGFQCYLVYVDPDLTAPLIRQHLEEFGHESPAILDNRHRLVEFAGATITPEVCVFSPKGEILYRGRINNFYERLGRPRRNVTEHDLRSALDRIRDGLPISPARTQAIGCFIPTELVAKKRETQSRQRPF